MREIKFRAWDKQEKQIVYPRKFSFETHETLVWCWRNGDFVWRGEEEFEIMQYTGLEDKNGKEIYEGDIIKAMIDYGPGGEHQQVFKVTLGSFGVNIQEWNYKEGILPEVIGNIHENPELLENAG